MWIMNLLYWRMKLPRDRASIGGVSRGHESDDAPFASEGTPLVVSIGTSW